MLACLAPWSNTIPLTNLVEEDNLCTICMISTMCKSIGLLGYFTIPIASTTISTNLLANSGYNLVCKEVLAILNNKAFSGSGTTYLNSSKNLKVSYLAVS